MQKACTVLIVGAGPTGLVLALSLAKQGIKLRIIDSANGPGETSRAMALHARTLEFYSQLEIAEKVIQQGIKTERINIRKGHKKIVSLELGNIGQGLSPYPYVLSYPQDQHERFLINQLAEYGVYVDRNHRLLDFVDNAQGVAARVENPSGIETIKASWICGCDGAHSQVRRTMGVDFSGGTFPQLFYVADVQLDNNYSTDLMASIGVNSLALRFPIRSQEMQRLIGLVPFTASDIENINFTDIQSDVEKLLDIQVKHVNWFATYKVHHRVAEKFHSGRAFLLGDAAHIHSPAGGQGMNTGIGDAYNLAWKLTEVISQRATHKLLDSYEPERIAFARKLVVTTDKAMQAVVGNTISSRLLRSVIVPHVMPLLTRFAFVRKKIFTTVSQIQINYRHSSLCNGQAGKIEAGDRLPWVSVKSTDNYVALKNSSWQVHVYGEVTTELQKQCNTLGLSLTTYPWSKAANTAGMHKNALYLIRPDSYLALVDEKQNVPTLLAYIKKWDLVFLPK